MKALHPPGKERAQTTLKKTAREEERNAFKSTHGCSCSRVLLRVQYAWISVTSV